MVISSRGTTDMLSMVSPTRQKSPLWANDDARSKTLDLRRSGVPQGKK